MADFTGSGWGLFVSIGTLLSVIACWVVAWLVARAKTPVSEDGVVESTGHVWDEDLQELNNPLPRWWLYLFYITCLFSLVYLLLYPGLGTFKGSLEWSSASQYELEVAKVDEVAAPLFAGYLAQDITAVAADPEAQAMGERLFLTYCSQCHGSDARGARSYPNLTDHDWLGAGDPEYIKSTILNGRSAVMPAMLAAIGNTDADAKAVGNYVMSLSGSRHDEDLAKAGKASFAVCAACHGADGSGNAVIGAPDLTDDVWLYGGSVRTIQSIIGTGLDNRMPPFSELLGEGKAHVLAAYIWGLSNDADATSAGGEAANQSAH